MRRSPVRIRQAALKVLIKREAQIAESNSLLASRFLFMESSVSPPGLTCPPRHFRFGWAVFLAVFVASLCAATSAWAVEGAGETHEATGNLPLRLLFVFVLVLFNGFFVASEFALVAVRKTRIDQLAAGGNRSAIAVQNALKRITHYIGAVQVGVTLASLLLGGLGEQALEPLMLPLVSWLPAAFFGITRTFVAAGLAYFVMTTMHVVLGELLPKALSLQNTEKMALVLVRPIGWFAKLVFPLVWFLTMLSGLLLRALGLHQTDEHGAVHSPEELDLLVKESHKGGELNDTEAEILHRVVKFSDLTLREVMVPRVEMQALPVEMTRGSLRAFAEARPHSRVPVYHGSSDEIIGILHLKDVLPYVAKMPHGDDETVISLMGMVRETLRLPETMTVDKLLTQFKGRRQQMAIVIDEFGGTSGLITLGDLLEQVFGEINDEFDNDLAEIRILNEREALIAGRALISEVNEEFETGFPQDQADTFAGLVLSELGRPAVVGDEISVNGALIRVEAVERLRIAELRLTLPAREPAEVDGD